MGAPFFSIIIPTLNEEVALPHLLEDLLAQTMRDFDVRVVDGKSQDATPHLVRNLHSKQQNFSLISCPQRNVSAQRNLGAEAARGEYILFLDADTRVAPNFLHDLQDVLRLRKIDGFTCFATPDSRGIGAWLLLTFQNYALLLLSLIGKPYSVGACMGVERSIFHTVGMFDSAISHMEDSELARRIRRKGGVFTVIQKPIYTYSLRRQRKVGSLALIIRLLPYFFRSCISDDFSTPASLYPMDGGTMHQKDKI